MKQISRVLGIVLLATLGLLGCSRGPDASALQGEIQERLTQQLKPGLLEVTALKRQGSAPLPASGEDGARVVVYHNLTLRFAEDYAFGSWEKLSPASLAYLLGATEKGIVGIKPENKAGDLLYVYGSTTYESHDGAWQRVASAAGGGTTKPDLNNTAPPLRSKQLIDRLAALVDVPPPGVGPSEDKVISEELDRAADNIKRRLDRRQHVYTVASGPRDGQYMRFGDSLVAGVVKAGAKGEIRNKETEGSVQNARMLMHGEADYALMQGNVAADVVANKAPFAGEPRAGALRAIGSLFPEPVQLVVSASSKIERVTDLRGKRIDIGTDNSGTQHDALLVLAAHGIKSGAFVPREDGGDVALRRLQKGDVDAVFITMAAPARSLQPLATRGGIRLLSLQDIAVDKLVEENHGLIPITLPANTYPGQSGPVRTVATAALLVTTSDVPDSEVERLAKFVYGGLDFTGSAEGVRVSKQTALLGITIPMHPGASRFFGEAKKP